MNRDTLPEIKRTLAVAVATAVATPLVSAWTGPFTDHPERAVAVLGPLAVALLFVGRPIHRDRRVVLGGGYLLFFLGFCLLFSLAAGSDVLAGRRTPLVGYEQGLPTNVFGLNRLGDWRYSVLPAIERQRGAVAVLMLPAAASPVERRRQFAVLIRQAVDRRARGIAFDFYFDEPSPFDALLCAEVRQATATGVPVYFGYRHDVRNGLAVPMRPPESLACLQPHLASLSGYLEADGRVRMVPLYFQRDAKSPTLSLMIARHLVSRPDGSLRLPDRHLVQFTRPTPDTPAVLWSGAADTLDLLNDRFVLVGSNRPGDVHETPFGRLPGVKIHELAAYSLSHGRFIERLGTLWTFPLIFTLCFVLAVAQSQGVSAAALMGLAAGLIALTIAIAAAAMRWAFVWVDVSYAALAIATLTALLLAGSVVQAARRAATKAAMAVMPAAGATAGGATGAAEGPRVVDVFLSHNGHDKEAVRALTEALLARHLDPWLDERELVPGRTWQDALERVILTTRSAAVIVGKDGLGPWEIPEMRACLQEAVTRKLPVIPVLLPGASVPDLPLFLRLYTWVDFRNGIDEAGLDRLQWGITGIKPKRR